MKDLICQHCGSLLDSFTRDGLCHGCMLRAALEGPGPPPHAEGAAGPALPRPFGGYELQAEIGRGGMGVIYRARQTALNRTVAVKLLLAGVYSGEAALHRFQLEAEAAAGLQHPIIVAIHDYGEFEGQPFYAMDLVEGRNLAALCDGRPLDALRAAEILQLLAGAVHYAHQQGVLHRDLKPANVLVDRDGRPRITDFGLAKRLRGGDSGTTLAGQMLGSPSYAAPEQAAGLFSEIGVATDIYGLGSLFYHLITGRAPFTAATPTETLRLVLETDPPAPRLLNPALPRDLETICLKCLAKEPARRFASAQHLREDVERFLTKRPILARPPSASYRMGRFARRHHLAVMATGAIFAALALGLGFALAALRRAEAERRTADHAREQAEALLVVMTRDLRPIIEQRGGVRQVLASIEASLRYYEALPAERRGPSAERGLADALAARARIRGLALEDRTGAEADLTAALDLRRNLVRRRPDDAEAAASLLWDEFEAPLITGDTRPLASPPWMEEMAHRALELTAHFPHDLLVKRRAADLLAYYAQVAAARFARPKEAVAAAKESRRLVDELRAARPDDPALGDLNEKSLRALATALMSAGEIEPAVTASEESLRNCTVAWQADPGNALLRIQAAEAARNLSYRCFGVDPRKAVEAERFAREHYRVLAEMDPSNEAYRFQYAIAHMMECNYVTFFDGDLGAAREAFRRFDELLEPFVRRKGYEGHLESWVTNRQQLALVAALRGDADEARRELDVARARQAAWHELLPANAPERRLVTIRFLSAEARILYFLGDWKTMAEVAQRCLAEAESMTGSDVPPNDLTVWRAVAQAHVGVAEQNLGRPAEAIARLRPALAVLETAPAAPTVFTRNYARVTARIAFIKAQTPRGDRSLPDDELERELARTYKPHEAWYPGREWKARILVLAACPTAPSELPRALALAERAERHLTGADVAPRITVRGRECLETIARIRASATTLLAPGALEAFARELAIDAEGREAKVEQITRAGEMAWNFGPWISANASPAARDAELTLRSAWKALAEREPDNVGFRFLHAATHRLECYVHFGLDGNYEEARAAFRRYDGLLEPFVHEPGFGSVRRTRLTNALHLAHLAASVGDRSDAGHWLAEAGSRFEAYRDSLPATAPDHMWARIRFLEESAWTLWWLQDWPRLADAARAARAECVARLGERPADDELLMRRAMADAFAALASAGTAPTDQSTIALTAAVEALDRTPNVSGVWDVGQLSWYVRNTLVAALRDAGNRDEAMKRAESHLNALGTWVPQYPDYWHAQKQFAAQHLLVADLLDPAVPAESAKRSALLDRASAILAPDRVEGRLALDLQEMLRELDRLQTAAAGKDR